jgi:predicted ATPase
MIPILVSLTSDYTVLYKQPEVHLHPKFQSKIADCFIEVVNNRKSTNSFRIVETHSEHFVLRLLRRVRESFRDELLHSSLTLKSNDFSLIYFKPVDDSTEIYQIRVSEAGDFIDDWPDGFFDERDEDIWGGSSWDSGKWGG